MGVGRHCRRPGGGDIFRPGQAELSLKRTGTPTASSARKNGGWIGFAERTGWEVRKDCAKGAQGGLHDQGAWVDLRVEIEHVEAESPWGERCRGGAVAHQELFCQWLLRHDSQHLEAQYIGRVPQVRQLKLATVVAGG
eukprot:scaffold4009_cov101-Isochrysis_galbana.AAC.3